MKTLERMLPSWRSLVLSGCLWSLGAATASASPALVTNTGLQNIHFKSVRCGAEGVWTFDIVNNNFAASYVEYFFWLEDEQGDAMEADSGQLNLDAKSRESVQLTFGCDVPFTELRPHFRRVPVGVNRPK